MALVAADPLPKITPYLLERGDRLCPRRLACELAGRKPSAGDAFTRWRVRDPLVDAASLAQATFGLPEAAAFRVPPPELEPEEQVLFSRAAARYLGVFGSTAAVVVDDESWRRPTVSSRRGIRLGGGIDVVAVLEGESTIELRQLELWGRPLCADPFSSWAMAVAVLRLSRWARGRTMLIRHVDLLGDGGVESFELSYAGSVVADLAELLDERLSVLRAHAAGGAPAPGVECGGCGFIADCPALRARQSG